jgi:hypothetical protein
MRRTLFLTTLLLSASAFAQTTIDITSQAPATTVCSYPTDHVATGSTPGHLAARLTGTATGAGCPVGGSGVPAVTFGPASPLAPNIAALAGGATTTTPVAASFTAQPLNAASCTAAIVTTVGLGVGALTGGATVCSGNCSNGTALSIPATFTNPSASATTTYSVTLTCIGAVGSSPPSLASSVSVTQLASGAPTLGCATIPSSTVGISSFTQLTGTQNVSYFSTSANVDVTSFDAIYQAPWPGNPNLTAVVTVPTNKYIAAKFHVPAGYLAGYTLPTALFGSYTVNNSGFSTSVSLSISTACGDFSQPGVPNPNSTVVAGCWKNKAVGNGFVQWRKDTSCILQDNHDYYLNFINADVSGVQALNGNTAGGTASSTKNQNCGTSCTAPIANNPGSWPNYTFP